MSKIIIEGGIESFTEKRLKKEKIKEGKDEIITIVSAIRQEFRKGTDLLIEVVPEISKQLHNVNFIIGGDGPKKIIRYYD